MRKHNRPVISGVVAGLVGCGILAHFMLVPDQQSQRPGNSRDDGVNMPRDLSGLSIKNPRVRVVHTEDAAKEGGSMYLQQVDPWLGYQWGRNLFQRNFRERDGVYGQAGKLDGILLADGVSRMMD